MKRKKRVNRVRPLIVVLVLLVAILIAAAIFCGRVFSRVSNSSIPADEVYMYEPVNVLVLGVDAGDLDYKDAPKRSDTMMIIRYVPQTREVYMLSIPRDTRVYVNGKYQKMNAVNAIGGPELVISTIKELFNININYYVSVDYEGFKECIDAIGGVDVVIPTDMDYDAYDISIHFNEGETVHLDGQKAEQFVRWRKNNDGSGYAMGDLGRIETQQSFLLAVADKLKATSTLTKMPGIINTVSKYVETNMSPWNMMRYFLKLKGVKSSDIKNQTLAGTPEYIGGISYYLWDQQEGKEYLAHFQSREEQDTVKKQVDRTQIRVVILNSTGVNGLAKSYMDEMKEKGYNVLRVDNYSQELSSTQINTYGNKEYGQTIIDDLGFGIVSSSQEENEEADVVIILGRDSIK